MTGGEERTTLAPLALVPVLVVAGIGAAVLLLTAGRYGYHRDELYFLACARHMAWGFVDQPPLTPAIAKLSQAVAPDSLVALRVIPALIYGSLVVLAGLTARELGAGRTGQLGASLCAATAPGLLLAGHLLSTTTPDLLVWALVSFLLIRLLRTEDERLWLAIGLTVGVGLENKWSIGFLVIGLLIGLLVTPQRRFLKTPWFVGGAVLALVLWAPNLWWQWQHGWPQIALFRSLGSSSHDLGSTITWLPYQFLITGPVAAAVWVAGLFRLLKQPEARTYRAIAIAYVVLAVVLAIAAGDKQYYVAGLYVPLWGAGGRPLEGWLARHRTGPARAIAVIGLALTTLLLLPASVPVLPESALANAGGLNPELGEQIGWPDLVSQVAGVWRAAPRGRASRCGDPHRELRRGRSDRSVRTERGSAARVQRSQHVLVVGIAPGLDPNGRRGRLRGPRLPGVDVRNRATRRNDHQPVERRERRRGPADLDRLRPEAAVAGDLVERPPLRLSSTPDVT